MDREVVEQKLGSLRHCLRHMVHSIAKNHLTDFAEFARLVSLRCT
jgi:hypothetical protein